MGDAAEAMQQATFATLIMGYFFTFILGQLLAFISHLSLYLHCLLFNLSQSPTENPVYSALFSIVQFDPIPNIDELLDWLFDYFHKPLGEVFEQLGYESQFTFFNMGSQFIILAAQPAIYLTIVVVVYALKACKNQKVYRCYKKFTNAQAMYTFNMIIQYTTINYTLLCVMAMINVYMEIGTTTYHTAFKKGGSATASNLFSIILLLWLTLFPIILAVRI